MSMESYIVRVYRRGRKRPDEVAGLVETVATEEKKSFQNFSGLVTAIRAAVGIGDNESGLEKPIYLNKKVNL